MDLLELCKSRRSIRRYKPEIPEKPLIEKILEAAIWAPSGCNEQPWFFSILQNHALMETINQKTKALMSKSETPWIAKMGNDEQFHLFYHAPVVIIVSGRKTSYSSIIDCSAATQNMLLMAHSCGLGSCWIGLVDHYFSLPESRETLGIPKEYEGFFAIALGYPDSEFQPRLPVRNTDVFIWI
jgi:nitroreductase